MGRTTEHVGIHKDRQLVSLQLNVSKLKGVGEDTLFIGIMQVSLYPLLGLGSNPCMFGNSLLVPALGKPEQVSNNSSSLHSLSFQPPAAWCQNAEQQMACLVSALIPARRGNTA
jgi:hypothetical protein